MAAVAIASRAARACTIMAGVYTAVCARVPVDPAAVSGGAEVGPVYHPVTHFIPWEFPLLRDGAGARDRPAPAADRGMASARARARAGLAFLPSFVVVQWPFANFLMTPLARNRFFGTDLSGLQHAAALALRPLSCSRHR